MKLKIIFAGFFFLFACKFSEAQRTSLLKMGLQERRTEINKMSQKEKSDALKQFKEDLVLSELQIPDDQKDNFVTVYNDYQAKQKLIKNKFKAQRDFNSMTEDEASSELDNSFEVGQQLLDLRKEYAEKFSKIIKPQKVLQLFQTEGMMRSKMMNHQLPRQK
ncbi:hypothetical protein [Halpernia frigidisoli]|uniref:Uncharacterized protein n=1 Tax=Halpernia frigidisoli TaxID=1125876 RepID=A0A1I3H2Z2_9FLAO|nr:hypothetical protein [Halpernia frigidisoli]SFI29907.1 hypothetical protein SAMN05443292_2154 [Halpernia frigidisoli]